MRIEQKRIIELLEEDDDRYAFMRVAHEDTEKLSIVELLSRRKDEKGQYQPITLGAHQKDIFVVIVVVAEKPDFHEYLTDYKRRYPEDDFGTIFRMIGRYTETMFVYKIFRSYLKRGEHGSKVSDSIAFESHK